MNSNTSSPIVSDSTETLITEMKGIKTVKNVRIFMFTDRLTGCSTGRSALFVNLDDRLVLHLRDA